MIRRYEDSLQNVWDMFVENRSMNGSFQQTRRFLNYHGNRFKDHSLLFYKGEELIAVLPGNELENGKIIISHQGATFGGLIISELFATITNYKWILEELEEYFKNAGISQLEIRMPSWLYARKDFHIDILEYLLRIRGFSVSEEVGFFIDIKKLPVNYETKFATLRRRKLKKALNAGLTFRKLISEDDIYSFYTVLKDNYIKFGTDPVHTYEDMLLLKGECIPEELLFYGVFYENEMIAGSMVFNMNHKKTFHTQYLASKQDALQLCPNEFLYTNLIKEAKEQGYRFLSYGTSTLEHGAVLNESLALFKEGFHTETYINRTYRKQL